MQELRMHACKDDFSYYLALLVFLVIEMRHSDL